VTNNYVFEIKLQIMSLIMYVQVLLYLCEQNVFVEKVLFFMSKNEIIKINKKIEINKFEF